MNLSTTVSRKFFFVANLGGLFLAIFFGVKIVTSSSKYSPNYLLITGIIHLFVLIIVSFISQEALFKNYAGDRIQTTGYIHTLIGFCVAISLVKNLGNDGLDVNDLGILLTPMSSALITSIIGWYFGSEIITNNNYSSEQATVDLVQALNKHFKQIESFEKKQIEILEAYQETTIFYHENYYKKLDVEFEKLNKNIENNHKDLFKSFSKINLVIEEESESLSKNFKRLNSVIEIESKCLSKSFNDLKNESQTTADCLSTTSQSAQVIANHISRTIEYIHQTSDYLERMYIVTQQLEELLKYVLEEKSKKL